MTLKEHLMSLEWNSFCFYPPQGAAIYLHCRNEDNSIHRFLKINKFNAVSFDFTKITQKFQPNQQWRFEWLPADLINEDL